MRQSRARVGIALAIALGVSASTHLAAQAQQISPSQLAAETPVARPATYGPNALTSYVIAAADFVPTDSSLVVHTDFATKYRYVGSGFTPLEAPVHLPNGALVTHIQIQGCDTTPVSYMRVLLYSTTLYQTPTIHANVFTGIAEADGCQWYGASIPPTVIDNNFRTYTASWQSDPNAGAALNLGAVRLYYRLQVSPAPGTATFADVPVGNPYHQFIEALVASGITGGCGGGNYCPDAPVTRGQMAVFLAAALGLHWPN